MEKRIREIVEATMIENESIFLVDIVVKGNSGNQKVVVLLDGDEGISIDECSRISRSVGNSIEEEELIGGKYILEVSSPGLDHPLKLHRQYVNNQGRTLSIETTEGEKIEGELKQVTDDSIVVEVKKEDRTMSFKEISQSKVVVSFK